MTRIGILLMIVMMLAGCATPYPVGLVYTETQMPATMVSHDDTSYTKVGTAQAVSVLGLVAIGDASQRAAIRDGQITKVKYVDFAARNILGIYGQYTTTVYGD